jgi:hypothetical protein
MMFKEKIVWAVKLRKNSLLRGSNGIPAMWERQSDAEKRAAQIIRDRGTEAEAISVKLSIEATP